MREQKLKIFKMLLSVLLVSGLYFNTINVDANQASSDVYIKISPEETNSDLKIPPTKLPDKNEQKNSIISDEKGLEGKLPKTGMPADNVQVNIGLILLLLGIIFIIVSNERDEEYEVL